MKNIKQYKKELIGGIILAAISFYGGMWYGQSRTPTSNFASRGNFSMMGGTGTRGTRGGTFGGGAMGQIVAVDATSITLQMPNGGGSRVVFFTPGTPVAKSVDGSISDLKVGENVSVNGTANSDGSISAQSIQLRSALPTSTK